MRLKTANQQHVKRIYRHDPKPNHILFDSNCLFSKVVEGDPFFEDIGLAVDVFHFKCKHKVEDIYCQTHCNPAKFPELLTADGGWYFNTSAGEKNNMWLGGFDAIVRGMTAEHYEFFLDQVSTERNEKTLRKLKEAGKNPGFWPRPDE